MGKGKTRQVDGLGKENAAGATELQTFRMDSNDDESDEDADFDYDVDDANQGLDVVNAAKQMGS